DAGPDAVHRVSVRFAQDDEPLSTVDHDEAREFDAVGSQAAAGAVGVDLVEPGKADVEVELAVAADGLCREGVSAPVVLDDANRGERAVRSRAGAVVAVGPPERLVRTGLRRPAVVRAGEGRRAHEQSENDRRLKQGSSAGPSVRHLSSFDEWLEDDEAG